MKFFKTCCINHILPFFILCLLFTGFITLYQPTKINNDGTGSINLQYFTKAASIPESKIIGSFAFTEPLVEDYFNSTNTEVKNVKFDHDVNDSVTYVTVNIDFKDISKLNMAKGFSNITASLSKNDSGMIFNYAVLKDTANAKLLTRLTYEFTFEGDIISTNGHKKESNTAAFVKMGSDLISDSYFNVVFKEKTKNKMCGTLGIELPMVLFWGMYLSHKIRKSKKSKIV